MTNAGNTKTLTKNYLFINVYIYFFTFKTFLSKLPNSYDFFLICSKTMDNLIKIFLNQRKNKIVVQKLYLMLYISNNFEFLHSLRVPEPRDILYWAAVYIHVLVSLELYRGLSRWARVDSETIPLNNAEFFPNSISWKP